MASYQSHVWAGKVLFKPARGASYREKFVFTSGPISSTGHFRAASANSDLCLDCRSSLRGGRKSLALEKRRWGRADWCRKAARPKWCCAALRATRGGDAFGSRGRHRRDPTSLFDMTPSLPPPSTPALVDPLHGERVRIGRWSGRAPRGRPWGGGGGRR